MSSEGSSLSDVSLWELPAYYRRLKAAVVALENAWEDGRLRAALADEDITSHLGRGVLRAYERLTTRDELRHSAFRRDSMHAVLEPVKELLAPPTAWFEVAPALDQEATLPRRKLTALEPLGAPPDDDASSQGEEPPETREEEEEATDHPHGAEGDAAGGHPVDPHDLRFRVKGPSGEVGLALHQLVSARFWSIGFEFDSRHDEALFVTALLREVQDRLAVDLGDLLHVQQWYRSRPRDGQRPVIVPDPAGRRYEQLMLDILNESGRCARRARLAEDFLEKTDARVRVAGVQRRRGARVQITQTTNPDYLAQKRAAIRWVNEYVILSPLPLAEAMTEPRIADTLTPSERAGLWRAIPDPPTTVSELALALKRVFLHSMRGPMVHPLGPMQRIPRPMRALVRAFVVTEARRTTSEMRARQSGGGRPRG